MEHKIIFTTCDVCNPQGDSQGFMTPSSSDEWKGVFEGPSDAAEDAGWFIGEVGNFRHICPECYVDIEEEQDET